MQALMPKLGGVELKYLKKAGDDALRRHGGPASPQYRRWYDTCCDAGFQPDAATARNPFPTPPSLVAAGGGGSGGGGM
jgi:hypothetical protein